MSNKPDIDPYYSVRDTVQETVDRIQTNHKKFQSLLKTTDTSSSNEFKDVRKSKSKSKYNSSPSYFFFKVFAVIFEQLMNS